jgi:hypothetical protein
MAGLKCVVEVYLVWSVRQVGKNTEVFVIKYGAKYGSVCYAIM